MSTTKDAEFDYPAYVKQTSPDTHKIRRGSQARQQRRREAKSRITIRIDTDVLEQFKQMVPDGEGYQRLINQALRDWLAAQGVKELVREELAALRAELRQAEE